MNMRLRTLAIILLSSTAHAGFGQRVSNCNNLLDMRGKTMIDYSSCMANVAEGMRETYAYVYNEYTKDPTGAV